MNTSYAFDHEWEPERARLTRIESMLDAGTIRHLDELGVAAGWRCLEVGAGGGSVARWLCERVGDEGYVLATDLETRFLAALEHGRLEVRRHDIGVDELPESECDLVHTRLVLLHVAERDRALDRMLCSLKPGGWLLVEEPDFSTFSASAPDAMVEVNDALLAFLGARGAEPNYGRRLVAEFRKRGLRDMGGEGRVLPIEGGHEWAEFPRLTFERLGPALVASAAITAERYKEALALLDDPDMTLLSPLIMAVWGRRPLAR